MLKKNERRLPAFLISKHIMIEKSSLKYLWIDTTVVKPLRIPHFDMINIDMI